MFLYYFEEWSQNLWDTLCIGAYCYIHTLSFNRTDERQTHLHSQDPQKLSSQKRWMGISWKSLTDILARYSLTLYLQLKGWRKLLSEAVHCSFGCCFMDILHRRIFPQVVTINQTVGWQNPPLQAANHPPWDHS